MKRSLTLIAIFAGLCATSALAQTAVKQDPKQEPKQDPWKQAGADNSLREAFEKALYSLKDSGHGTFSGANDAQRLSMEFDAHEARLKHPDGSVGFHLAGYGYGDMLKKPESPKLSGDGTRLEYRRGDITEWYVNGKQGLEQGFTLAKKPSGANTGQPLTIALGVTGSLGLSQQGGAVLLKSGMSTVLRYEGLSARDALGRTIPAHMEARNNQIRLVVEDRKAQYPLIVDPYWTQQQELTGSDAVSGDSFGYSVALSGTIAVVGAYAHQVGNNASQGAAYVFVQSGSTWTQQQELTSTGGAAGDQFGYSVAVSGTTAVIGATGGNAGTGAAYVFVQSGSTWTQQQELTPSDLAVGDSFGSAVAVSGTTAVIGCVNQNGNIGSAYVFVQSGSTWTMQQKLTVSDAFYMDEFGYSVALDGATAVIGSPSHRVGIQNVDLGAAYVFVQSGTTWTQQQELTASDGASQDHFGSSVAVSGTTALIGSPRNGTAYVFVQSGSTWSQQQELTASDEAGGDDFGVAVALSGTTAVIAADGHTVNSNPSQGAAYVFVQSGSTWSQQFELTASDGAAYYRYGSSVAVSGTTVIVGDGTQFGNAAYAYVQQSSSTASLTISTSTPTTTENFQGEPVQLIISVTNPGGIPTAGVATISDTVDPGFTISSVSTGCTFSSQIVTCTVPVGTSAISTSFVIYATISTNAASSITNTATLADSVDTVAVGSSSTTLNIEPQAPSADTEFVQTSISGSTDSPPCTPGGTLTATVTVQDEYGNQWEYPYAANITLSGGNTLLWDIAGYQEVPPYGSLPFTFKILLATCNTFSLHFDVDGIY